MLIAFAIPHFIRVSLQTLDGRLTGSSLKGNIIIYSQDVQQVEKILPRKLDCLLNYIAVVFVGRKLNSKHLRYVMKVRPDLLLRWLKFLVLNNHLYANIKIHEDCIFDMENGLNENGIPTCLINDAIVLEHDTSSLTDETSRYIPDPLINESHCSFHVISSVDFNASLSQMDNLIRFTNHPLYVSHHGSPLDKYKDDYIYEKCFPCLFPFGIGGPKNNNLNHWINHTKDYYQKNRQFQKHEILLFHMFSDKQSRSINKTLCIMENSGGYSDVVKKISTITDEDIDDIIESFQDGSYLENDHFKHVMRGLKQIGRYVFGSPFERSYNRQLARGMLTAIGLESFMFTVNFDDTRHPLVLNFAGISIGWKEDGSIAYPSKEERRMNSSTDAFAVAEFAQFMMLTMFHDLFGFDIIKKRTIKDGGIFGHLKHVLYQYHDQKRGGLHIHFLGWIAGYPDPETLLKRITMDDTFKEKYIFYVDQCFQVGNTRGKNVKKETGRGNLYIIDKI